MHAAARHDWAVYVIAAILVVLALAWTRPVSLPLTFALFLMAVAWPLQDWLERRLPRWLGLLVTLLVIICVLGAGVAALAYGVGRIADGLAEYGEPIERTYREFVALARRQGFSVPATFVEQIDMDRLLGLTARAITGVYGGTGFILLTLVFVLLGLLEVPTFHDKVRAGIGQLDGSQLLAVIHEIGFKFRRYILVRTFVSLLTGILTWLFSIIIGLELALVWGLLAFVLNYIPFVGSIAAVIPPVLFSVVQFESWQTTLIVLAGMSAIQITIGNYIDPRLEGRALAMSPLVVVISIFFWGLVWGVPGAFIGVPLTLALMTAAAAYEPTRWIAMLFGSSALNGLSADNTPFEAEDEIDETTR